MTTTVIRRDSRAIAIHRLADGPNRTIVLAHPAPGAGTFDPGPLASAARGITLLAPDRPGYGGSEPVTDVRAAAPANAADDLAAVIEAEIAAPVGLVGWSAGGRVALELAARRPELVDRLVIVATPAPHEEVPWIPARQLALLEEVRATEPDRVLAGLQTRLTATLTPGAWPSDLLVMLGVSDADGPDLAPPDVRDRLLKMLEDATAQGMAGLAADVAGYALQPWEFDPAAVRAKTLLVYGSRDPVAAQRHGAWWQRRLPNARLEMTPASGHFVAVRQWPRILSFLAPAR